MKNILTLVLVILFAGCGRATDVPLDVKQSYLKFTGHAFLHDFDGEAKQFSGTATLEAASPKIVTRARIEIQSAKMTTFESTRDQNMFKWLGVEANPIISFQLKSVKLVKGDSVHATKDHPAEFMVTGDFTLNKISKPLEAQALGWYEGRFLIVTGNTKIDTVEHGLPIIRQLFMTVGKDVDVAFHLVFELPTDFTPLGSH